MPASKTMPTITCKKASVMAESKFRMKLSSKPTLLISLLLGCISTPALAQERDESTIPLEQRLGLDAANPQVGALPGGMTPAFNKKPVDENDWRFDFHGFLRAPLKAGFNKSRYDQDKTVIHAPPVVPDDKETFSHTGVVDTPYTQLNLSYGSSVVTGNASIVADQATNSTSFFDPPAQLGVNDVFLSIVPKLDPGMLLDIKVGTFTGRYGIMGEYDEGRYGTPVIARIRGVGESVSGVFALDDFTLMVEQGIKGQSNKASGGIIPDGWNGFADPNEGSSFITHFHAGLGYKSWGRLGLHYVNAFSADERATGPEAPDASMNIMGADLRLTLQHYGHLYLAASYVDAEAVGTLSRIVEVLNAKGGPGLIENYLGDESDGNGSLLTIAAQYDLSLGRLLSYPVEFYPDGPDIFLSVFALQTQVSSDDPDADGITKRKFGFEGTYSFLSWLGASLRYDKVDPNVDNQLYSFSVISPRLIFKSDWGSTDQITLQYSHWFNGSLTTVRTGYPPQEDVSVVPDEDMVSLTASMWW
jgi:hypothetical protein